MAGAKPPSPISWPSSQWWDGDDGEWSSFDLRVGTPEQLVRVLPSTAGSATWVVTPGGCESPSSNCSESRGGLFNQNQSTTWNDLGPFTLALEQNLGHNESGAFGLDTIALGLSNATGGPTVDSQIIAGIETEHWYIGLFGLQQQPMNLTDFSHPQQSVLSALRARELIPSLSWSYTAGARYRSKGSFGSLTLGGSDISKYVPTNVSFTLAPDVTRDLVVGIQSITSAYLNGSVSSLLPSATLAFIDSTVPYLYLPESACKIFESELGLVYNQENNIYFLDNSLHQRLSDLQPQFTFRLGNDKVSKPTVDITLPYASFDLTMKPPLQPNATKYFPLRQGADDQVTLGRAFLQEAYVIADYDYKNFTVAQALFNEDAKSNIVSIPWNATVVPGVSKGLSRQAIIGISTGSIIFVLLMAISIFFSSLRWRKNRAITALTDTGILSEDPSEARPSSIIPIQEIGHQSVQELHAASHHIELLDGQVPSGSGMNITELPDWDPAELLAPARQDDSTLPSEERSASSANTNNDDDETPDSSVARASDKSTLSLKPDPRQTTLEFKSPGRTKIVTENSAHISLGYNVNKALPQAPLADNPSKRTLLSNDPSNRSVAISKSIQMPTAAHNIAKGHSIQENNSLFTSPRTSPTYATVFNIEEYEDSAVVSPPLSPIYKTNKTT